MKQCFRLKKCYGNKAEEYADMNNGAYPNEAEETYNILTVTNAFKLDAL
jgi:hypothetical protein